MVSLPSERSARSQTSPGRVSERCTLPLLGLGRVCSRRTQRAFGTAMRLCASLFRGVAAPLGCVVFFAFVEVAACTPCAQCFPNVRDEGWYGMRLPSYRSNPNSTAHIVSWIFHPARRLLSHPQPHNVHSSPHIPAVGRSDAGASRIPLLTGS